MSTTRTQFLEGLDAVGSWEGTWIDSYGGTLQIAQTKTGLGFELDVVRGESYHSGWIVGVAEQNGVMARFTDAGSAEEEKLADQGETWVTFVRDGARLKVLTANAIFYHGARAYFDGEYARVSDLDAAGRAKLLQELEPSPPTVR